MRVLFVHPSALLYSEIFLRLEPLGLERVAAAARAAGHDVRVVDLQVFTHRDLEQELAGFRPEAVGFGLNYLANVPEVIELAHLVKRHLPGCFVFAGGHSVSFIATHLLEQADGAVDAVVRGEGEPAMAPLLAAIPDGAAHEVAGVVTADGAGPSPQLMAHIDEPRPARDLMRRRRCYFIGVLDPAASIEFTRGCPWDCSFCSAWTFYGRSYRKMSPEAAADEMASIREPGVFIVDPHWDLEQFRLVREWALSVPEIVHLTVMTPYPGTEIWHTESRQLTTRDYRLFDIQHAVLPTTLPLDVFYRELVKTQAVINRKHLGVAAVAQTLGILGGHLLRGQTNFARMLWKFNKIYNAERQYRDHQQPVCYRLPVPDHHDVPVRDRRELYVHPQAARH